MSVSKVEKPIRTIRANSGAMWCESCEHQTVATHITTRIYKGGKEVERQVCSDCENIQETEYFKGPTTRIKNKK